MRRWPLIAVVVVLAAACSSSPAARHAPRITPTTARPDRGVGTPPVPSPGAAAVALARRMLGDAVLPPGAAPARVKLTRLMRGPWEAPAGGNLVHVNRVWTAAVSPEAVVAFLKAHPPRGFDASGVGQSSSPTERVSNVTDVLRSLPVNVAQAGIEVGVEARGSGALINVVAGVQWTAVRPATELVGDRDPVVVVTTVPAYARGKPIVRRVVVRGVGAAGLARAFDALRVEPPRVVYNCPLLNDRTVAYRLAFAKRASAPPDVVATLVACGSVVVEVAGRRAPSLTPSSALDDALARALGRKELSFVR